jgi:hypothetical protein
MDPFEQLVSEILWMEGYWVRTSVKVELTKEERREIGPTRRRVGNRTSLPIAVGTICFG